MKNRSHIIANTKRIAEKIDKPQSKHTTPKTKRGFSFHIPRWLVLIPILAAVIITILALGVDTQVIKLTVKGKVVDQKGVAINDAKVELDSFSTTTNTGGEFTISGLTQGNYQLNVIATDYLSFNVNRFIGRDIDYVTDILVVLSPANYGTVAGRFVATDNPSYQFIGDELLINNKSFPLLPDGSFKALDIATGVQSIVFKSKNYQDITLDNHEIIAGDNQLPERQLVPAGDISGELIEYISGQVVADMNVVIEGITKDQYSVDAETGKFVYRDLTPGVTYKLRITKEDYQARDHSITVNKGDNFVPAIRPIRSGSAVFVSAVKNQQQVFISDLDGQNPRQLTSIAQSTLSPFLNINEELVYFIEKSTNDVFSVGITANTPVGLTKGLSRQLLTKAGFNMSAKKFSTSYNSSVAKDPGIKLEVYNFNGKGTVLINQIAKGEFVDPCISDNGNYIYYSVKGGSETDNGFFRANINTGSKQIVNRDAVVAILDCSSDGSTVLYTTRDTATNSLNLKYANAESGENVVLAANALGTNYRFINNNNKEILFIEKENNLENIYRLSFANLTKTSITKTGGVTSFYEQNGLAFYYKASGMYVIDLAKPLDDRLFQKDGIKQDYR